ncbi:MAG: mandelate racemase/muconate lactonizing enzyme family protein [Candidatus Latescibacterota bacterium]|jgi:galactonate dehydratase
MKITDIRTADARFHYIRVYTDEGIYGTGECSHVDHGWRGTVESMKGMLIGRDPLDVDACFELVRRAYIFRGGMAGLGISALSGIEIALWDLAGKALGVPVYRLLGGRFRDRVRLYVDSAHSDYGQRAAQVRARGFTAIKFDLDDSGNPHKLDPWNWSVTPDELRSMVDQVAQIREAIGPSLDLAIDLHGRYDSVAGMLLAQALEPFNLMWLEEPVPPENIDALKRIKEATRTPICAGENLYLRYGFRDLLEKQAVDIIMPDISKCGGLSECRKIANLAEIYYVPFAPHNNSGPLSLLGDSHVCASVPNFLALEWHRFDDETWDSHLATESPIIERGHVVVPNRPGIGAELDEEYVRQFARYEGELFQ